MKKDKLFLRRAIEIAGEGIMKGGGPFGAIVSKNGIILSEAYNRVVQTNDPTAHAEILAIRQAATLLGSHDLSDCTLYSSCEPCPMCLGAIYWSSIKKVVYNCDRTDAEEAGFSDKLIYEELLLDPAERKIEFMHLNDTVGKEIFSKWDKLDNKISY